MSEVSLGNDLVLHSSFAAVELFRADSHSDGALNALGPVKNDEGGELRRLHIYHIWVVLGGSFKLPIMATSSVWHRVSPFQRQKMIPSSVSIS